ncbi:hypothetical protein BJP36_38840 [Moorena producens JHB]|uniref:Uncharacterized protein n=1 Tax=Moorena producens (strain JHB) TaxID=1454205 RepID=A0A9Q9SUS2_MOOP1|nr:hypothetical protein [Moorena producens]WAN70028.1 hypothetical protein BJP36_38840 [Moorena producens JHB]
MRYIFLGTSEQGLRSRESGVGNRESGIGSGATHGEFNSPWVAPLDGKR